MKQEKEHLMAMIKKFDTAMLVTKNESGEPQGRPMGVARAEDDGVVFFSASLNSPKVNEIDNDPSVAIFFQQERAYVSLYGTAEIVTDRAPIDAMWKEEWRVWFPDGKDSADLCLIKVIPSEGEFWDVSGTNGVKFVFDAVKAYVTGSQPPRDESQNAKVAL